MSVEIEQSTLHILPLPYSSGLFCNTYAPGHNVHWIQALRSANDRKVSAQTWSGKVTAVDGQTTMTPDWEGLGRDKQEGA